MKSGLPLSPSTALKALAVAAVALVTVLLARMSSNTSTLLTHKAAKSGQTVTLTDIPLPFGPQDSQLAGSITLIGRRFLGQDAKEVYEVRLTSMTGPDSEQDVGIDKIYLVLTPDASVMTSSAPLDLAISPAGSSASGAVVNYYGYKYSDMNASVERANRSAATFAQRFPQSFLASLKAWQVSGADLSAFQSGNGITFAKTGGDASAVKWEPNSLYAFVFNEQSGAKIHPAPVSQCGNSIIEGNEECDLGSQNGAANGTCTSDCKISLPMPFPF